MFVKNQLTQAYKTFRYKFNEIEGKTTSQIAHRILGLQLVLTRWGIEAAVSGNKVNITRFASAKENLDKTIEILAQDKNLKLQCFTPKEFDLLKVKSLGTWDRDNDIYELDGLWEQFGTLQYIFNLQSHMPEPWQRFNQSSLFQATSIQPKDFNTVLNFINNVEFKPRSEESVIAAMGKTEVWFWRAQAQSLLSINQIHQQIFKDSEPIQGALDDTINDLPRSIALSTERASKLDYLEPSRDGKDFLVAIDNQKIKYGDLEEDWLEKLKIIALNRKHAFDFVLNDNELSDVNEPLSDLPDTPL